MTLNIEDIRRRLLDRRAALIRSVAHVEDDLRWLDTNVEPEVEEEGQEENIARLLDRLDSRQRADLGAIDAALARLATGDYGRCEVCDRLIPAARLDALPTATKCLSCALAGEHRVS